MAKRKRSGNGNGKVLGAADWLRAARDELIKRGVMSVKVDRLARKLHVTRGSFYWHFKSRDDLLKQLLNHWITNNTEPFKRVLTNHPDAGGKFQGIIDLWLAEDEYDPRFDTAVRDWARVSPQIARSVRRADDERIAVLTEIFRELGYADPEATVRARITYFHQVGYYALGIVEETETRRKLRPFYTKALMGQG
jgi:AcrR family transcriptional regulator